MPGESIQPSIPTLCNLGFPMFYFGVDFLHSPKEPQHDLPSLAPAKGEMGSSFSWTCFFKSPTPRPLCLGDPTLANLNQVKLLCETEFGATKTISIYDPGVHPGTTFLLKLKADRRKGARVVLLQKSIHVVNYIVNFGVEKSTCLTSQEHLQHAWDITF